MKRNLLFTGLLFLTVNILYSQTKNASKFYRPSMTNVVLNSPGVGQPLVEAMKKISPQSRFDNHAVSYNAVSVSFPSLEEEMAKTSGNLKGAMKEIKAAQERHEKACQNALMTELNPLCNQAVGLWWSRDEQGNMSDALITQRGLNTATDADVIKDKASENSRLGNLGYELISRSYFTVYELSRIRTMEEVYNDLDAKAKKIADKLKKPYTPIKRTEEGYVIDYNAYIVKIDWNDSVQSAFWEYLWVDRETNEDRASKVNYFKNTKFPMQYITQVSGTVTSTQSNDPAKYGALRRRLSMQELLLKAAPDFQEDAMFKASKKVEDFRLRSPFFTVYPNTIKLGTKEGIYIDQRFFVYETRIDEKTGEKKPKRMGVLRPTKIAKNDGLANGNSEASKFRQQGGKNLYQGMYVEMKEDRGYSLSLGFIPVYVSGDISLARAWKKTFKKSAPRIFGGLRIGGYISMESNSFENIDDYTLTQYSGSTTAMVSGNQADTLNGAYLMKSAYARTTSYGVFVGREIYPFKKGNFYLYPQIGLSASARIFNKYLNMEDKIVELGEAVSENSTDDKNTLTQSGVSGALGMGYHLNPWISLTMTPSLRTGSYTYGQALTPVPSSVGANMSLYFALRIKF